MTKRNAKRPHELALEKLVGGEPVSPTELEAHVGNGPYASKHIWFLRKQGHDITINKNGRSVVSYVYNGPGTYVAPAPKPEKKAAKGSGDVAPAKKPELKRAKATKPVTKSFVPKKQKLPVETGKIGETVSGNFAVDPDFDAVDVNDII